MRHKIIIVIIATLAVLSACTEQGRARGLGGTMTEAMPCDRKVFDVTWKGSDLWYATRPIREDEDPEVLVFHESALWGVWEGTVKLRESLCPATARARAERAEAEVTLLEAAATAETEVVDGE